MADIMISDLCQGHIALQHLDNCTAQTVNFFICSAYTDFVEERKYLQQHAYPQLREYAKRMFGMDFRVIDLPLGIEHLNYEDYNYQKLFCQYRDLFCHLSSTCCPVIFVGQKFGLPLLPAKLPSDVFNTVKSTLRSHRSATKIHYSILDEWYRREDSVIQGSYHVLRYVYEKIEDVNSEISQIKAQALQQWADVRKSLATLFKTGFLICLREGTLDEKLIKEYLVYEFDSCIDSIIQNSTNDKMQPIIFQREIIDLKNYLNTQNTAAYSFMDLVPGVDDNQLEIDPLLSNALVDLNNKISAHFTFPTPKFSLSWRYDTGIDLTFHASYLTDLNELFIKYCKIAMQELLVIQTPSLSQVALVDSLWNNSNRCANYARCCVVDYEFLNLVKEFVKVFDTPPSALFVEDLSGLGKFHVANAITLIQENFNEQQPFIIIRTLTEKALITDFYADVWNQIKLLIKNSAINTNPKIFNDILQHLENIPHKFIFVFISCEFLVTDDKGTPFNEANFLLNQLPGNTKLILSTSLKNSSGIGNQVNYCFNKIDNNELEVYISNASFQQMKMITYQQKESIQAYASCVLEDLAIFPFMVDLFVNSNLYDSQTYNNVINFDFSIVQLFCYLEEKYGYNVISHAASFICLSGDGLTDLELEDCLSLCNNVLADIDQTKTKYNSSIRFPAGIWASIKSEMSCLLHEKCKDGYILNFWGNAVIDKMTKERYLKDDKYIVQFHYTLADYFLGTWHGIPAPFKTDSDMPIAIDRLVPSQEIVYQNYGQRFYNVRQYRQLPRHLCFSERFEELNVRVLFSFDWMYHKIAALGVEELLSDYKFVPPTNETKLVEEVIKKSLNILSENLSNLGAELIGQLLPYSYENKKLTNLIKQCDLHGSKYNGFLPSYPYSVLPGLALQNTVVCPTDLRQIYLSKNEDIVYAKLADDPTLYQYDTNTGQLTNNIILSNGNMYMSMDFKYFILVDDQYMQTVKIHRVSDGSFVGQIVLVNFIESRIFQTRQSFKVHSVDLSKEKLAVLLRSEISYLFIINIANCKIDFIFLIEKQASFCKFGLDMKTVFTNANDQLISFDVDTKQRTAALDLLTQPEKMIFNIDSSRAFLMCHKDKQIVILQIKNGQIAMSYKITFANSLGNDIITDIKLADSVPLLMIQSKKNIIVYDYNNDSIVSQIRRPAEIPEEFKIPNSEFTELTFTNSVFAFDDKAIISSIFRDIIVWNIGDARPVALLHAPVGIITNMLISKGKNFLLGYVSHSHQLHLWNLKSEMSDGAIIDSLTRPIKSIQAGGVRKAIAICSESDELGVVDLNTGFLTDLYTHEGHVLKCCISQCGQFAIVAIRQKRANTTNIVWSLQARKILKEFGNCVGYFVAEKQSASASFLHIAQSFESLKEPFQITKVQCTELEVTLTKLPFCIPNVKSEPFITMDGSHLLALSQTFSKVEENRTCNIFSLDLTTQTNSFITPSVLCNYILVKNILQIWPCNITNTSIIVLFSENLPDSENKENCDLSTGDIYHNGVLILDVATLAVISVYEKIFSTAVDTLYFSPNGAICLDSNFEIFLFDSGVSNIGKISHSSMKFWLFALHGECAIFSINSQLCGYRVPDGCLIGSVNLHSKVMCVALFEDDERTLIVGCENGNIASYTLVDPIIDDVVKVVAAIPSRAMPNLVMEKSRTWDKVPVAPNMEDDGEDGIFRNLNDSRLDEKRPKTCCVM